MVRVVVGFAVMGLVMFVVDGGLMRYARRHGYEPYWHLEKNAAGVAGLTGLGVALPIMGRYAGLAFLLPALVAAGLFRWWYRRPPSYEPGTGPPRPGRAPGPWGAGPAG